MDRELAGRLVEDNPDFTAFSANIPPARPVDNDPGTSAFGIPLPLAYGPPVTSVTAPARGVSVEYEATAQV